MIEVTKINGVKVLVNPDLIELVEETPDTVLTLTRDSRPSLRATLESSMILPIISEVFSAGALKIRVKDFRPAM